MASENKQMKDAVTILYASQTGNAEFIAKHIAHLSAQAGFKSDCIIMDDYPNVDFSLNHLFVFVTSTTGDGDPPDNSTKFWRFFKRGKPEQLEAFKGKSYALVGLGDTNYTQFNEPAKKLDKKLISLGCISICKRALVDDAMGLEAEIDPWIESFIALLPIHVNKSAMENKSVLVTDIETILPLPVLESLTITDTIIPHLFKITDEEVDIVKELSGLAKLSPPFITLKYITSSPRTSLHPFTATKASNATVKNPGLVKIEAVKCLTGAKAMERVIELQISVQPLQWDWIPGDAIGIVCPTPNTLVEAMLKRLGVDGGTRFVAESTDGVAVFDEQPGEQRSKGISAYELLRWIVDLHSFPKKSFFREMSECATDPRDKRKLLLLSSIQGNKIMKRFREEKCTVFDVFCSFPSVSLPLSRLLELLPRLQPRYYSIASSPLASPLSIKIAFNIIKYEHNSRSFEGLCSTYLDTVTGSVTNGSSEVDAEIYAFTKPRNDMILSSRSNAKVIMICAGTGVTPFISLIEHYGLECKGETRSDPNNDFSERQSGMWLFYGCRFDGNDGDMLYRDKLMSAQNSGVLNYLTVAYSREDSKQYVQDQIRVHKDNVKKWVDDGAVIYVCGGLAMSKDVHNALADVLTDDESSGVTDLLSMMAKKRYIREIWG